MAETGLRCECCELGRHDLCKGTECGCDHMFRFGRTDADVERLAKRCLLLQERIALLTADMEEQARANAEVTRTHVSQTYYGYFAGLLRQVLR